MCNLHFFGFHKRILKWSSTQMKLPQNDQELQRIVSEYNWKKIHKGKNEIIFSIAILVTMPFITEEKKSGFKKHLEKWLSSPSENNYVISKDAKVMLLLWFVHMMQFVFCVLKVFMTKSSPVHVTALLQLMICMLRHWGLKKCSPGGDVPQKDRSLYSNLK